MKDADLNTEQRILEAAEQLFLEKGFALSSTVEIARMANCNQALVHYYFRSKEKLFEKVFEKKASMFLSSFLKGGDDALSFEEKIKMKIESHFDMIAANPRLPFLFFNEILTNPNRLRMVRETVGHLPTSILSQLQQDLDVETVAQRIRPITAIDLMVTVFSLNVILFLVKPVLREVVGISEEAYTLLLAHRKKENVETILKSLRP